MPKGFGDKATVYGALKAIRAGRLVIGTGLMGGLT